MVQCVLMFSIFFLGEKVKLTVKSEEVGKILVAISLGLINPSLACCQIALSSACIKFRL